MKYTIFILCLLVAFSARAANPAFSDFNTNQFNPAGNKIVVKNGALLTNTVTYSNATFNGIILATNAGITNLISGKLNIGSEPTDNNRSLTVGSGIHAYQDAFGTSFSGNGSIYSDAALSFGTVLQKQNAWSMNGSLGNFLIRDATDNPMTNFMFGDYETNLMFGIWWNSNPPALYLRTISNTIPADFWISGTFHGDGGGLTNLSLTNVSASGLTLYGVTTNGNTGGSNWVGGISLWNPATGRTIVMTNGTIKCDRATNSVNLTLDAQGSLGVVLTNSLLGGSPYLKILGVDGAETPVVGSATFHGVVGGFQNRASIGGTPLYSYFAGRFLHFDSTGMIDWNNSTTDASATKDTGITRNSAGVVEVNNGTAGNLTATLKTGSIIVTNTLTATNGVQSYGNLTDTQSGVSTVISSNTITTATINSAGGTLAVGGNILQTQNKTIFSSYISSWYSGSQTALTNESGQGNKIYFQSAGTVNASVDTNAAVFFVAASLRTNMYSATAMTPTTGEVRLVCSNYTVYAVSPLSTNALW